jgi:hypothetical protein
LESTRPRGRTRNRWHYEVRGNEREGKRPLGRPGVGGKIILRLIFRKWDLGCGLDWAGSGWRKLADTCECGNELSGSIKCGEFLDWLRTG